MSQHEAPLPSPPNLRSQYERDASAPPTVVVLDPGMTHEDGQILAQDKVEHAGFYGHDVRGRTHDGVQAKHYHAVSVLGRIGWVAKGIVYAIIGGLCCRSGANGELQDTSPQGAFELLGSGKSGKVLLVIEMAGVATYVIWRFWEGITAQGSHPAYGKFKNFFSFRLSPLVSGFVYCAYLAFCCSLIPKTFKNNAGNAANSDFTRSWHRHWYGRLGLVVLGVAFTAAFLTQVQMVVTRKFHRDIKAGLHKGWRWATIVTGHIGVAGRAAFFLLVAILMYRSVSDGSVGSPNATSFGNALSGLRIHRWGRAILFLIGFALIIYGLYACLVAFVARIFPTPGPTPEELEEIRAKNEKKADKRAARAHTNGTAHNAKDVLPTTTADVVPLSHNEMLQAKADQVAGLHKGLDGNSAPTV